MPINFSCPHCKRGLSVKDELAGKSGRCPRCKMVVTIPGAAPRIPEQIGTAKAPAASPPAAPSARGAGSSQDLEAEVAALLLGEATAQDAQPTMIDFTCPFCRTRLYRGSELIGRQISCPNPTCRRIIYVPTPLDARHNE